MNYRCPSCSYDLAGLGRTCVVCPECGGGVDGASIAKAWDRRLARRWRLFWLSPLFGLPGIVALGVGMPILTLIFAMAFAYRALDLDDELYGDPSARLPRVVNALGLGIVWSIAATVVCVIVLMVLSGGFG